MKRGTPMKRTAFKRAPSTTAKTESNRALALVERALSAIKNAPAQSALKSGENHYPDDMGKARAAIKYVAMATTTLRAIPKAEIIRSKAYLRIVAQLPCMHCGIWGHSQAAHANTGKGMGLKACDLQTFPLCCDRPGQRGCHSYFDSGALFSKEQRRFHECRWVAKTQSLLLQRAVVPKKLIPFMEHCHG